MKQEFLAGASKGGVECEAKCKALYDSRFNCTGISPPPSTIQGPACLLLCSPLPIPYEWVPQVVDCVLSDPTIVFTALFPPYLSFVATIS